MINIEENYVGGGPIASSTSAVNYVDVPMSLLTTSSYYPATLNTQFLLTMQPNVSGRYLYTQILDSSGVAQSFTFHKFRRYASGYNANSSNNTTSFESYYPVYNNTGYKGINILINAKSVSSGGNYAPTIYMMQDYQYSSSTPMTEHVTIQPRYNAAISWATIRFYFDSPSGAYVGNYDLYAGV